MCLIRIDGWLSFDDEGVLLIAEHFHEVPRQWEMTLMYVIRSTQLLGQTLHRQLMKLRRPSWSDQSESRTKASCKYQTRYCDWLEQIRLRIHWRTCSRPKVQHTNVVIYNSLHTSSRVKQPSHLLEGGRLYASEHRKGGVVGLGHTLHDIA